MYAVDAPDLREVVACRVNAKHYLVAGECFPFRHSASYLPANVSRHRAAGETLSIGKPRDRRIRVHGIVIGLALVEVLNDVLFMASPTLEDHIVRFVSPNVFGRFAAMDPPTDRVERSKANRSTEDCGMYLRRHCDGVHVVVDNSGVEKCSVDFCSASPLAMHQGQSDSGFAKQYVLPV